MIASTSAVRVAPARAMAPRARVVSARRLSRRPLRAEAFDIASVRTILSALVRKKRGLRRFELA